MQNILPKPHFSNSLRIEKLRANRSKSSLSIALFYFPTDKWNGNNSIRDFLRSLEKNTRETDIKGWVDQDVIGLILPDTDERGLKRCVEKIKNEDGNGHLPVVAATYPDHLFEKLLSENENPPDIFPIELDKTQHPDWFNRFGKRCMDITGSLAAIVIFSCSPLIKLVTYSR